MRHRNNDPKQMASKFPGTCAKCKKPIKKGEEIIYFPIGREVNCVPCGDADYRAFLSSANDEEVYNGGNPW